MLECSKEAFARCPYNHPCGRLEEAFFLEGSDCDKFNQSVAQRPQTNADRIRAMSDYELAVLFAKTKAQLNRLELFAIVYSTQDVADNLEWLYKSAVPYTEDKQHSGLIEEE